MATLFRQRVTLRLLALPEAVALVVAAAPSLPLFTTSSLKGVCQIEEPVFDCRCSFAALKVTGIARGGDEAGDLFPNPIYSI